MRESKLSWCYAISLSLSLSLSASLPLSLSLCLFLFLCLSLDHSSELHPRSLSAGAAGWVPLASLIDTLSGGVAGRSAAAFAAADTLLPALLAACGGDEAGSSLLPTAAAAAPAGGVRAGPGGTVYTVGLLATLNRMAHWPGAPLLRCFVRCCVV